ncbi:MAG: sortase [Anaerolineaceae bacterium]|nr:sortase [Anaerolineaceae bacterium]
MRARCSIIICCLLFFITGIFSAFADDPVTMSNDGSDAVGQLKILARYNDSMQFYDGHTYLLFTSYQDGITITVPDLYAGYEISDRYYSDIRADISYGSNHTGTDTDKYFTFNKEMKTVTLDRGEIVTIGMYRDFDLSIAQAALGTIMNSSAWTKLESAGKGAVVKTIFDFLDSGTISAEEALARIQAVFEEIGADFNLLIDGVVDGGVCFNRELYNQKLEWDQFENVTYELDITREQLEAMVSTLSGNLNKFSIIKNSCATVAVKAWNAAVGADSELALDPTGEGIFALVDAPKGLRDDMVEKLDVYLNTSEGVEEPNAFFRDDTGYVYVSAPEVVNPVEFTYADKSIRVDESKTKMATLVNAAKAGSSVSYNKEEQIIPVTVVKTINGKSAVIEKVVFSVNGTDITVDSDNIPETGIWFNVRFYNAQEGEEYYITDAEGHALPSDYSEEEDYVSFLTTSLPVSFTVVGSSEGRNNILKTTVINGENLQTGTTTEVYIKQNGENVLLSDFAEVTAGTMIYIKPVVDPDELSYALIDITLNGETIMVDDNYDAAEGAYTMVMPGGYSQLNLIYQPAVVYAKVDHNILQVSVGETLSAPNFAELRYGAETAKTLGPENVRWKFIDNADDVLEFADNTNKTLKSLKEGKAVIWAGVDSNDNIGIPFTVEVCENTSDMVWVTFNEGDFIVTAQAPGGEVKEIPYSGYKVKKGSELTIVPQQTDSRVISGVMANGKFIPVGEKIIAESNTDIAVAFLNASITGVPRSINLDQKGDSYQLNAEVDYGKPLNLVLPVYDGSIRYESSDPDMVSVDENGLITVTGDVPAGGKAVIVTAYAGSSNDMVSASCKVILGNYDGEKIVGKLTVNARPIQQIQLIAHGAITFTAYEDLDLNISYYHYYKPTEKFVSLMKDYEENPGKYSSDPALYNNDELGLGPTEVREKIYFEDKFNDSKSKPKKVSLKCGESITLSNYGYGNTNLKTIFLALENSSISSSVNAQELIKQLKNYFAGEEMDGTAAYDSLFATLVEIIAITRQTGVNPADGQSAGGLDINREAYNQFRRDDSQLPNHYYSVDITKDELTNLQSYIGDPKNNYYSLFVKNCATGTVEIWNTTLRDRPELHLTANYTGIAADPQSLYFELGLMQLKPGLDGEAGTNFYPRLVASDDHCPVVPPTPPTPPTPVDPDNPHFYRLCTDCLLPGTGFSAVHATRLSAQSEKLNYSPLQMRIQIPSLNLETELVNVPLTGSTWQVEWLGDRAGLLSGSALPGKGLSIIAAHNTLNDAAYGPFALLSTLDENAMILVNDKNNHSQIFRVFANELLDADGMDELLAIAEREENTLALVTCENEDMNGGYLNRRVIFAKAAGEL